MRQFDHRRAYRLGWRISPTLHEVLTPAVTVRRRWTAAVNADNAETLFHEVSVVPFDARVGPEEAELLNLAAGTVRETAEAFYSRLFGAVCGHIAECWEPGKAHVLFHSSGWDSRIMAWAVKALAELNGAAWLGKLVVFTFGPEAAEAQRMAAYEGWPREWVVAVPEPAAWLHPLFDMERAGEVLNGAQPTVPVSRYWLGYMLHEMGAIPELEGCQFVSGFGSDYALMGAGLGRLRRWAGRMYQAATSIPLALPECILPWLSYDVLRVATESSVRDAFKLRPVMCEWLDARLASFRRVSDEWPELPGSVTRGMVKSYEGSWYGRVCAPGAAREAASRPDWSDGYHPVQRSAWWSHWTAACYCERLRREGYNLL